LENIPSGWGGEVYIKDYDMDGRTFRAGFFQGLVGIVNETNFPILLGGGVRNLNDVQQLMDLDFSKGVMIGNWLNSQELLIPRIKSDPLLSANLRKLNGFK
jgi:phosphoribosylformimino-5-aminoimidazole carboxamide ribonucleotide (ProFAR) isomerase